MIKMKLLFVILSLMALECCDARTVDGGKIEVGTLRGRSPLAGPFNFPLIKSQHEGGLERGVAPGLNDIQGGLMDKADNIIHDSQSTTTYVPTVSELNDIKTERVEDERPEHQADEPTEDFDLDIIVQKENDPVVVMRRMFEEINKRLSHLTNRVSTVEQTTTDIWARLTDLDCYDLQRRGQKESGIYTLHMDHNGKRPVDVACDMKTDGGGWTVIQKRSSLSKNIDFDRGWHDYKMGFGNVSADFWIGLENIYIWTNTRHYEVRIDLTDFDGETSFAHYAHFYIENEDNGYRLHISGYSGTAGDCMGNEGKADNFTADGMMFTTHDEDHDTSHEINCAKYWKIGGWWFNRCSWANLNGPYKEPGEGDGIGINWHMWRNKEYLHSSTIMIRPARNI